MVKIYETDLKRDSDGTWYRWLGENAEGTKQKFRLGQEKSEAERRIKLILAIYSLQLETDLSLEGSWVPEYLSVAKKIAKGKQAMLPRLAIPVNDSDVVQEFAETYAKKLAYLNMDGEVFQAEKMEDLAQALKVLEVNQKRDRTLRSKLTGSSPDQNLTGQTIGLAVDAFLDHLRTQNTLPDGSLTTWGKTQINQVKSWRQYMLTAKEVKNDVQTALKLLQTDLADLTVAKAQQLVDATGKRPLTFESKLTRRMKVKSATSINKKIKHFFDWLDLSDEWQWREPPRFRKLTYKVSPLTDEELHEQRLKKKDWRVSDAEIQTLYQYATPSERILILLGLNCAFGAGEIGNLRIPYVKFETQEIDGIRFKTGSDTRHHLWSETVEGLRWEFAKRERLSKTNKSKDIFFLSQQGGDPLWSRTKNGNYKNGISKRWNDLIKRVRKDHPNFPLYSFGKLRKTAAIRVIELADAETASMILAHGIQSEDTLLSAYVNIPWEKLYAAQKEYGEKIRPLLKTETPPFEQPAKNYIGLEKSNRILMEYKSGIPISKIAQNVGVSIMTVHRHLNRAGLVSSTDKK